MTRVLVTGGTGVLGRRVVARLREQPGVQVRVLSRSAPAAATGPATTEPPAPDRPEFVHGDLETGAGLTAALAGVDVVVHAASSADYRRPERDVEQTRRLIEAARPHQPHLVYISIVGVDRIRFGYYRAKLAAERLIEASGLPWTILRTTQFHELALMFMMLLARAPVVLLPRDISGQPVDAGEVADRVVELALAEPAGRAPDLGGPRVEAGARLMRLYLKATGRRRLVLAVPVPGRTAADFRGGGHLVAEGARGQRSFEEFLRERLRSGGGDRLPYRLRRR